MDALTAMIMASTLTENDVGDPSQVAPLLDQVDAEIVSVIADGAYDGAPTYDTVAIHGEDIAVVIPPPVTEHCQLTYRLDSERIVIEKRSGVVWMELATAAL